MENQSDASKSPLSPPNPKEKHIRFNSPPPPPPPPPSKINIEGPHLPMIKDNVSCLRGTVEPERRPNMNGKNKNIDFNMHRKMENFEKMISEGVKKFVKEYYKKNPDEAWTDQEHEYNSSS